MSEKIAHAPEIFSRFGVAGGELVVGDLPLRRLVARVGSTPFFAYSRDLVTKRVAELRAAIPEQIHISYAVKANPMPALVQHMATLVDGFDVASGNELRVALDTPTSPARISFAGPGKRPAELSQAIAAGVLINVESANELETIADISERLGTTPRIGLRVNPDFEVRTSGLRMGGGAKAFGVDAEQAPGLLRRIGELKLGFEGLHIFSGSQIINADALIEIQNKTIDLAIRIAGHSAVPLRILNIGGGLGLPYFPGERPLDLEPIGRNLQAVKRKVDEAMPGVELGLELGRFLVGEAGIYVCRVTDRKVSRGKTFLVTDGGLHHHLVASGNFGQVLRRNYPVAIGNRMGAEATEPATVSGCLCTPNDVLARDVSLPAAEIGDYVVVFQSGAYGLTTSPTLFLSHPPPIEVLI